MSFAKSFKMMGYFLNPTGKSNENLAHRGMVQRRPNFQEQTDVPWRTKTHAHGGSSQQRTHLLGCASWSWSPLALNIIEGWETLASMTSVLPHSSMSSCAALDHVRPTDPRPLPIQMEKMGFSRQLQSK